MTISTQNTPYLYESSSDVAWFFLLSITPANSTEVIRLVNNNEPVVSNGETYIAYPFDLILPLDTGDKIPSIKLRIDNVDQMIVDAIRELELAPKIRIQVVTSAFPDLVEKDLDFLQMRAVEYNASTIEATLEIASIWARKFPGEVIDPTNYPSLFFG